MEQSMGWVVSFLGKSVPISARIENDVVFSGGQMYLGLLAEASGEAKALLGKHCSFIEEVIFTAVNEGKESFGVCDVEDDGERRAAALGRGRVKTVADAPRIGRSDALRRKRTNLKAASQLS